MVVGNGFIASAFSQFQDSEDVVIFASGVSNSRETRPEEFLRERKLLETYLTSDRLLVYFSTTSIFDQSLQDSMYILHKKDMEALIREKTQNHLIFRLPIMVGASSNKNTLINFLTESIEEGKEFKIHANACRYLMSIDDIRNLLPAIISNSANWNNPHNVFTTKCLPVPEIVKLLEAQIGKKGNYELIERGDCYEINISSALLSHPAFKYHEPNIILASTKSS